MKKLILFILTIHCSLFTIHLFAQNPEWVQYLNSDNITCLAETEGHIWAGAWEGGLIQIDKSTGNTTFYGMPGLVVPWVIRKLNLR